MKLEEILLIVNFELLGDILVVSAERKNVMVESALLWIGFSEIHVDCSR